MSNLNTNPCPNPLCGYATPRQAFTRDGCYMECPACWMRGPLSDDGKAELEGMVQARNRWNSLSGLEQPPPKRTHIERVVIENACEQLEKDGRVLPAHNLRLFIIATEFER